MNQMQKFAAMENAAARMSWGDPVRHTPNVAFDLTDPNFEGKLVPRVMSHLRAGDGVEDMQAVGTCSADEARQVIAWMRSNGSLGKFYQRQVKQ